jgi:5-methylcytosine-specific restriction endonuclease McrA
MEIFNIAATDDDIKREKSKARELRKTSWWKSKISSGICYYCKSIVPPNELTMDHLIPLSVGGKSVKNNLVAACKECNSKKKDKLPF